MSIIREPMAAMYGKWAQAGVPKKGWTCTDVQDLGSPQATCEMCETQTIRYVHTMTHPHYATELNVGCVCAEKMESDYVGLRLRERKLRSIADRKKRWLTRRGWRISARGNSFINTDGFNIVIFSHGDGSWGGRIAERNTGRAVWLKERYNTADAAKLAIFDATMVLKNKRVVTPRAEAVPAVPVETGIAEAAAMLEARRPSIRPQAPH
jgi:hypothetical protein